LDVEQGEKIKTKGIGNLFNRIIAEKFSNCEKERVAQVQEAYRIPICQYQKRNTSRHIIIKNKARILNSVKEKLQVMYKGKLIRITVDFSTQTLNVRRLWKDVIQALNESNSQPSLVYPPKLSIQIEREIKTFHNKEKQREFMTTKSVLQKILRTFV
jgi:hypothetical protein